MTFDIYLGGLLVLTLVAGLVVLMTSTRDAKSDSRPTGAKTQKSDPKKPAA